MVMTIPATPSFSLLLCLSSHRVTPLSSACCS
jgi:hypothetical protein